MGYERAKWHSGLTYRQVCGKCNTTVEYTDDKLGFRYWFPDGFIYCPNRKCKTPLRHSEEFAIDVKPEVAAPAVEAAPAPVDSPAVEPAPAPAPVVEAAPAPVAEVVPAPVEEPVPVVAEAAACELPAEPAPVAEEPVAAAPVVAEVAAPAEEPAVEAMPVAEPVAAPAGKKAMEAPFCTKCGTPFDAGECFCAMCGAKRAIKYI